MQSGWFLTLAADDLLSHVLPHEVFGTTWLNNHMFMALVAAALVLIVTARLASRMRPHGRGIDDYITRGRASQIFEVICEFLRDHMARPALGPLTDKYIYYVWTVFFFVVFCNLLGLIPFGAILALTQGAITGDWDTAAHTTAHLGGTATSNLGITGAMATLSFVMIVGVGVREQGIAYFKHFCPVPPKPWPMLLIAVPLIGLEAMGLVIKCVVLAMRLFGNMLAGHLVIAALIGLIITYGTTLAAELGVGVIVMIGATAISLLELFVALLQAFIFTFLTVLFIAAGAVHHDEHHEEHAEHETVTA